MILNGLKRRTGKARSEQKVLICLTLHTYRGFIIFHLSEIGCFIISRNGNAVIRSDRAPRTHV